LKELLGIPDEFHIFFTGSATEVWERSIQNLVEKKSLHFVNGAFSKRYHEIATQLGKTALKVEAPLGKAFSNEFAKDSEIELVALTHNETSTGVSLPISFINEMRTHYPDALVVVDSVSSLPYPQFDFTKIDSLFFSVQKGFGLPAGLGVWIVNDRCLAKAESLLKKGISIGTYHNLITLAQNAKKNQTPETPNVLGIYLLSKVQEDFLRRGISIIRKETEYKAAILYQALSTHGVMKPFVTDRSIQSQTVIVAQSGERTKDVSKFLNDHGLSPGEGYGENKSLQLRFANFPAHSKEQFELLVDTLEKFK
jgi:Serine-pyruvate aminotransferase/archaeal aspartate aminotransferase